MGIEISKSYALVAKALDYRAMRQDMIASNIANADTPFYKPRDIRFEDVLVQKKDELLGKSNQKLEMARTNSAHLKPKQETTSAQPKLFFRDGHMARNDGNSVDIDVETTEMSKNSIMFNALIQANKKETNIFKSVIDASSKIS